MAIDAILTDLSNGNRVKISPNGELITSSLSPNISIHHTMDTADTSYNFAPPQTGFKMRLQNILMYADKNVGVNDASIVIFTANSPIATTGTTILELELPKFASRDILGLNLELPEGVYLNAKTNEANVFLTMMGYYAPIGI